jgi:hypothetical protein
MTLFTNYRRRIELKIIELGNEVLRIGSFFDEIDNDRKKFYANKIINLQESIRLLESLL